jgi:hypothetical protein
MLVPYQTFLPQEPNTLAYSCYFLSQISTGEVCKQKHWQFCATKMSALGEKISDITM